MHDIIKETINSYLIKKEMLKEYKNPKDAETLRVCADMLEEVNERMVSNGTSRNEITMQKLEQVITELRKLTKIMAF